MLFLYQYVQINASWLKIRKHWPCVYDEIDAANKFMQITSNKVLFLVKDEDIVQDKFEAVRMFLAFIYD